MEQLKSDLLDAVLKANKEETLRIVGLADLRAFPYFSGNNEKLSFDIAKREKYSNALWTPIHFLFHSTQYPV